MHNSTILLWNQILAWSISVSILIYEKITGSLRANKPL